MVECLNLVNGQKTESNSSHHFLKFFGFTVLTAVVCSLVLIKWKSAQDLELTPVIMTSDGPVQGSIQHSRDGQKYWQFLGIPYAKPPVGKLSFQPPVPVEPWENTKQVTSFPPNCAQYDVMMSLKCFGELDCLYLNVFVNVANGNGSRPVLVYIHGGAFISGGSQMYQPEYFMDQNVVLVMMNYRLGPYGFLNLKNVKDLKDENVPQGNMGFLDQLLVLKWIQTNIGQFGGDANKVTLFGESAGAVASHLHLLSPMSRGLIHRAILQSASSLPPWSFSKNPTEIAMTHAKRAKCLKENEMNGLLECYKNTEWKDLIKYQNTLMDPLQPNDMFVATIDGKFLDKRPHEILKSGNFPAIPIMFGVNSGEGGIRSARFEAMPELIPKLDSEWEDLVNNIMILDEPLPIETCRKIRETYFGTSKTFTDDLEGFKRNLTLMVSDAGFYHPNHVAAIYHAKIGAPVYMYYFNYTSSTSPGLYSSYRAISFDDWLPGGIKLIWSIIVDWMYENILGVNSSRPYGISHGEDLLQLWNIFGITKYLSSRDSEFSHSFVKAIVDFANGTNPLTFRNVSWPRINDYISSGENEYNIPYMLLDNEDIPRVVPEPFGSRIDFWTDLLGWNY